LGYCRIQGEFRVLGHKVASSTIAKVLKGNGIRPAPERPSSWRSFLKAHWDHCRLDHQPAEAPQGTAPEGFARAPTNRAFAVLAP